MATPTYTLLDSTVLSSSAASVTFSSISQDFRDLVLVREFTSTSNHYAYAQFNGDTGSNYSWVTVQAQASLASGAGTSTAIFGALGFTTVAGLDITQIMDYSATDKHKTVLQRSNNLSYVGAAAYRWANTAAITSIASISSSSNQFAAGSTFKLFGIHGEA